MAEALGISVDEAVRRFQLQEAIGPLGAQLEANEADTFAGLWLQQEPEFRVVVAFTQDGEATMQPYVAGTPLASPMKRLLRPLCKGLARNCPSMSWPFLFTSHWATISLSLLRLYLMFICRS
jgi:hypothetical protein